MGGFFSFWSGVGRRLRFILHALRNGRTWDFADCWEDSFTLLNMFGWFLWLVTRGKPVRIGERVWQKLQNVCEGHENTGLGRMGVICGSKKQCHRVISPQPMLGPHAKVLVLPSSSVTLGPGILWFSTSRVWRLTRPDFMGVKPSQAGQFSGVRTLHCSVGQLLSRCLFLCPRPLGFPCVCPKEEPCLVGLYSALELVQDYCSAWGAASSSQPVTSRVGHLHVVSTVHLAPPFPGARGITDSNDSLTLCMLGYLQVNSRGFRIWSANNIGTMGNGMRKGETNFLLQRTEWVSSTGVKRLRF